MAIAHYDSGSANRTTQTITGVDLTVWHTYKIIVKHTTARYYVDDELKAAEISGNMPHNKSMPVRLDRVSWGIQPITDGGLRPASQSRRPSPGFPDLENRTRWPKPPETMSNAPCMSRSQTRADLSPDKGTVELDLKLRDTASGDQWRWIYEEELDALAANATQKIDIDPFLFTGPEFDEIEAYFTVDDLESTAATIA